MNRYLVTLEACYTKEVEIEARNQRDARGADLGDLTGLDWPQGRGWQGLSRRVRRVERVKPRTVHRGVAL